MDTLRFITEKNQAIYQAYQIEHPKRNPNSTTPQRSGNRTNTNTNKKETEREPTMSFSTAVDQPTNSGKANKQKAKSNTQSRSKPKPSSPSKDAQPFHYKCNFCDGKHHQGDCTEYEGPFTRKKRAEQIHLCLNCLNAGHTLDACRSKRTCRSCSQKHHTLLCQAFKAGKQNGKKSTNAVVVHTKTDPENEVETVHPDLTSGSALTTHTAALLMSVEVTVCNPEDLTKQAKALVFLDPGSQATFIKTSLANQLGLSTYDTESITLSGINGQKSDVKLNHVKFGLQPKENYIKVVKARTLDKIVNPQVTVAVTLEDVDKLNNKMLNLEQKVVEPDILIGIEYYHELKVRATKRLKSGFWLVESLLGNMLSGEGKIQQKGWNKITSSTPIISLLCHELEPAIKFVGTEDADDLSLSELVSRNTDLEFMGLADANEPSSEEQWLKHFEQTIQFVNGRYQVALPWREDTHKLPDNRALALGRVRSDAM